MDEKTAKNKKKKSFWARMTFLGKLSTIAIVLGIAMIIISFAMGASRVTAKNATINATYECGSVFSPEESSSVGGWMDGLANYLGQGGVSQSATCKKPIASRRTAFIVVLVIGILVTAGGIFVLYKDSEKKQKKSKKPEKKDEKAE